MIFHVLGLEMVRQSNLSEQNEENATMANKQAVIEKLDIK